MKTAVEKKHILLLDSCLHTCMTYTTAECKVNKLLMIDELSETCRVSRQNKFVKLVHLVGFIINKFVTMHGHMNVKFPFVLKASMANSSSHHCYAVTRLGTIKSQLPEICAECYILPRTKVQ